MKRFDPSIMKVSHRKCIPGLVTILAVCTSIFFYGEGVLTSPVQDSRYPAEVKYLQKFIDNNDPDLQEEKSLAEAYWLRYEDVKTDNFWGINGPMGIWGPRDHYQQHGKKEGRIFQLIERPKDMNLETRLAEAYWGRYPEIKDDSVWGKSSPLGILGPRDHYKYHGRFEGKIWGITK